jgi:TRAP-type uncharacterized transport system substrate-binding protein
MTTRIGTSEYDGTFYSQGRALKIIFERQPELVPVELLESKSASTENANRLQVGEIEFGFMASNWVGRAKNGEAPFAQPNRRIANTVMVEFRRGARVEALRGIEREAMI